MSGAPTEPRIASSQGDGYEGAPSFSVIIPTMNEARWIGATLDSLLAQVAADDDVKVLVIDTGSSDDTVAIASDHPIATLRVSTASPYVARNQGIERTRSSHLLFLDARCVPQPGWLRAYRDCARQGMDYVAGRTEAKPVMSTLGSRLLARHRSARARQADAVAGSVAACNMMVSRRVFDRVGRFAEDRSGSDIQFSRRAIASGFAVHYCESAHAELQCAISTAAYFKRRYRIRRGQVRHGMGRQSLLAQLLELPWRPGWREARRLGPELGLGTITALCALWVERWAGFAGAVAGHFGRSPQEGEGE